MYGEEKEISLSVVLLKRERKGKTCYKGKRKGDIGRGTKFRHEAQEKEGKGWL